MSDRRFFRWATTGARLIAGTVVAVAFVVGVVTAVSLPWPKLGVEPVSVSAAPLASTAVLTCTGDVLAVGRDSLHPDQLQTADQQSVVAGGIGGAARPDEQRLQSAQLPTGPVVVTADPDGRESPQVAAAGSATVHADDLTGFAASACAPALLESWLVGGSGATGAADLVLIANPGQVPATVSLTVFGSRGAGAPPGGTIVVPPHTQTALPLAGFALGEEAPVIRVTATGSPVQAALQTSLTRTLVPVGVDQVGAVAVTDATQVFPGIAVTQDPGAPGASEDATILRLLSPTESGSADITIVPVDPSAAPVAPITVPLRAAIPVEVSLGSLPQGLYSVRVAATKPIVSAVWESAGTGEGGDFAWVAPSPALSGPTAVSVPSGADPVLVLDNPGDKAASVHVSGVDGGFGQDIEVPAGASASVAVPARAVYSIDAHGATVRAAVSFAADGAIAAYPVWPADAATPAIVVYP